jgi:hypothetical protein
VPCLLCVRGASENRICGAANGFETSLQMVVGNLASKMFDRGCNYCIEDHAILHGVIARKEAGMCMVPIQTYPDVIQF